MHHYLVWLSRMHRCRGFGVQSPSVYWFIRYVVNEHYAYYAYDEMKGRYPRAGFEAHHLGRLLFRIANYAQADRCCFLSSFHPELLKAYIHRGCLKTQLDDATASAIYKYGVADASQLSPAALDALSAAFPADGVLVLLGIKHDRTARALWRHVVHSPRYGVTLDLYYCGIVFFDLKKVKANYVVNY